MDKMRAGGSRAAPETHPDAGRWVEMEPLLAELLALPAERREEALAERCGGDPVLYLRLSDLLRAAEQAPAGFLDPPPPPGPGASRLAPGDRVGPYRIEGRLGEGGMGMVFLARPLDVPYRRPVALKVLTWPGPPEQRHRFRRESEILAALEHPLIARLYDAGTTPDGLPYIAMERVEGQPIDRYCEGYRLTVEERLRLFLQVCAAVQYLHHNLLVHRDLKPSNIAVTADGTPKLLDFGIAKLLTAEGEGAAPTRLGLRPMTPRYASPEQVAGERITTASDVYSLGVLLYELLTGLSPYRSTAEEDLVAEVRNGRPAPASRRVLEGTRGTAGASAEVRRRARRLAGDLDAILARALCKDLGGRYASADELSRDLRRHLAGLPVAARRATLLYRGGKLIRRQAPLLAAAALSLLLLVGWLASMALGRQRLAAERDLAERSLTLLLDGLRSYDPQVTADSEVSARDLLAATEARVRRELADEPLTRARLLDTIGEVYAGLGDYGAALPVLEESLALRREHGADRAAIAESWQHLGDLQFRLGADGEAEAALRTALALRRELFGDDHLAVAETLDGLADLMRGGGCAEEAAPLIEEALEIRRRHLGPVHPDVAESLAGLAYVLYLQGDFAGAERLSREALEIRVRVHGEAHPQVAAGLNHLGLALERLARYPEAEEALRRALAVRRETLGTDHPATSQSLGNLAFVLLLRGSYGEAEELLREADALLRGRSAERARVAVLVNIASIQVETGRFAEAEAVAAEAWAIAREHWGEEHPYFILAQVNLGAAAGRRDPRRGEELLADALARGRAQWKEDDAYLADPLVELGRLARRRGAPDEAAEHLREALEIVTRTLPAAHLSVARVRRELAATLLDRGDLDEAARHLTACRDAMAAGAAADSPDWEELERLEGEVERRRRGRVSGDPAASPSAGQLFLEVTA